MLRFSANLSMLFQEYDFLDRFEKAAACGFRAVEFMFPMTMPRAIKAKAERQPAGTYFTQFTRW